MVSFSTFAAMFISVITKRFPKFLLGCFGVLALSQCATNNSLTDTDASGTGPFDSRGNYREDWADDPNKWRKPSTRTAAANNPPAVPAYERPPAQSSPLPPAVVSKPKPAATTTTSTVVPTPVAKPKPKPVVVKPKPKPKPKPTTRHVVKKGDTLSGIASRYGSSVSAIQRANGIKGSTIFPGKSLVIPK